MFGGAFAPEGWAICRGQILPISQFEALFTLIGNTYGGDGSTNFGLPDMQGRAPVHRGQGPGITQNYPLGLKAGAEAVALTPQEMPLHRHAFQASKGAGGSANPENNVIGSAPAVTIFKSREAPESKLPASMVPTVGGGQPHANRMPYVTITFIISLEGDFPPHG